MHRGIHLMNKLEKEMVALLNDLRMNHNVCGIKAEFEAEGTRLEEAMRLKDVVSCAGLGLNIKIGGCEAIKDMLDSISLGAERIIAPMIETPYALTKFIRASRLIFGENIENTELLANIETISAYNCFDEMLQVSEIIDLDGIVIGRVDFVGSMGIERDMINSQAVLEKALVLAKKAKESGLKVVIGGGVSADSLPFFHSFPKGHIDRFETRKVIFQCPAALENSSIAFIKAVKFELMWLQNKKNYYSAIAHEDNARITLLQNRYKEGLETLTPVTA